jgi:nucleoside-diphosphate-sugar epimerase
MPLALITGANGFCARHLARRVAGEDGCSVVGLDVHRDARCDASFDDYVAADIRDPNALTRIIEKLRPDFVFHLAGLVQGASHDVYRANLLGGIALLESVRAAAPGARVLMAGSAAEYGPVGPSDLPIIEAQPCSPSGPYAISKYAATLAAIDCAKKWGMRVAVARPFNIVGAGVPESLLVGAVLQRIRKALAEDADPIVPVGNLESRRDFVAVDDVVEAYWRLIHAECWGQVFNICSGRPLPVRFVVERLLSFAPRPIRLRVDPALVRTAEAADVYGSWQKAHRAFGFQPSTSLERALCAAWGDTFRKAA